MTNYMCMDCKLEKTFEEMSMKRGEPTKRCKKCYNKKFGLTGDARRAMHYKSRYGITLEQYNEMKMMQGGKCKICLKTTKYHLVVDHCHTTGKVRGLLCQGCNWAIGLVADCPDTLKRMSDYLKI